MNLTADTTVGAVAVEHPLATRVFSRHGIDFCCGGGKALSVACAERGVDTDTVLAELQREVAGDAASEKRWDQAPLSELIDHILATYHAPLREELERLMKMARKVRDVHGEKDPERFEQLLWNFQALKADLEQHMPKEEQILFPMILAGDGELATGPMAVMEMEHDAVGRLLETLRELTDGYRVPDEACTTWRALWVGLEKLEQDLHEHIHLENNVLHPRARGRA